MGTYVYYYLGDEYGIRTRFLADLGPFTEWFSSRVAQYPDDYPRVKRKSCLILCSVAPKRSKQNLTMMLM